MARILLRLGWWETKSSPGRKEAMEAEKQERIEEVRRESKAHPAYGYRRISALLVSQGKAWATRRFVRYVRTASGFVASARYTSGM